jgi:hypothetical protein
LLKDECLTERFGIGRLLITVTVPLALLALLSFDSFELTLTEFLLEEGSDGIGDTL